MGFQQSYGYLQGMGADRMTREQILDKMDRLLDDNHRCLQIMHDESSGRDDISEAEYQLESNCQRLAELHNQLREMEEQEKLSKKGD